MRTSTLGSMALYFLLATPLAWSADTAKAPKHLTTDQAVSCIKLAVAARAGNVRELEVDVENNRTICEVEVIDSKGKKFEVYVDVAANKVLRVED